MEHRDTCELIARFTKRLPFMFSFWKITLEKLEVSLVSRLIVGINMTHKLPGHGRGRQPDAGRGLQGGGGGGTLEGLEE